MDLYGYNNGYYDYPLELYHHGIKGMKWGVRRFQKKDGTLTEAGKKRYSDVSDVKQKNTKKTSDKTISKKQPKSTHRLVLEKKYRDSGMSKEEAKAAAEKRIKVEKVILGMAGVTVAACTAYYLKNKWTATYCDQVLKAGTRFHNLDSIANARPGEHLYVNYRQNDVNYFRGHFAVGKMQKTGHVFNHVLTAESDVKIPSLNTRKNVFKQLYDSDPEFRKAFNEHSWVGTGDKKYSANKVYKEMWMKFGDKNNPEFNVAKRKYFDALSKKGYDAIVDEWDTSKGVFRSDAPLILLNTSSKSFGEMSIKELTSRDILLAQANSKWYEPVRTGLTILGTPHTNHFKESKSHLTKYANKSAKNAANIDRVLSGLSDEKIKEYAMGEKGHIIVNAGKRMAKDATLTAEQAVKTADDNHTLAVGAAALAITYAPIPLAQAANKQMYVREYIKEHPNTKLTYNEIEKMYKYNHKVRSYQEKHPGTKITATDAFKITYGLM